MRKKRTEEALLAAFFHFNYWNTHYLAWEFIHFIYKYIFRIFLLNRGREREPSDVQSEQQQQQQQKAKKKTDE